MPLPSRTDWTLDHDRLHVPTIRGFARPLQLGNMRAYTLGECLSMLLVLRFTVLPCGRRNSSPQISFAAAPISRRDFNVPPSLRSTFHTPSSPSSTILALLISTRSTGLSSAPVFTNPILCTTLNPLFTLPKIVCFPSNHGVGASVMKN